MRIIDKPWGREIWWAHTDFYLGKILEIRKGHRLSLQKHLCKHETLYVLSGKILLTYNGEERIWESGSIDIPPNTVHRFEALEDSMLLEVSTNHPEDVVRLSDDYNRTEQ